MQEVRMMVAKIGTVRRVNGKTFGSRFYMFASARSRSIRFSTAGAPSKMS